MAGDAVHYYEIALGAVTNRAVFIPVSELSGRVAAASDYELYRSMYMYGPEIIDWTKNGKTIKGYPGTYALDTIVFDIDKGNKTDADTLSMARELVKQLSDEWIDQECIWPFFSGRGYHITTPDFFGFTQDTHELPAIVAATIEKHFPMVDHIYDGGRLIRVAHTKNHKSGKYKIPLTLEEFFSMQAHDILALAQSKRMIPVKKEAPRTLHTDKIVLPAKGTLHTSMKGGDRLIGQTKKSTDIVAIVTCAQKMYNEGDSTTHRHNRILAIASAWRRAGVPESAIVDAIAGQFKTLDRPEIVRTVQEVFTTPYEYGCTNEWMVKYCDPRCKHYQKKDLTLDISSAKQMEQRFSQMVRSDFNGMQLNLQDIYTLPSPYMFYPGEYVTFMGDTGLGKTAFVQGLMVKWNIPSILFSLENSEQLMYRRFIQIAHGMSKEDVIEHYKHNDNHLSTKLDHIRIVTIKPQLQAIREMIPTSGAKLFVVDTIDCIDVPFKNDLDKLKAIATELSALAQQYNIIIIGISHISKKAAYGGALDVHSASGPGTIEHRSDKVITIEGDRKANYRIIRSQKARDEAPFELATVYDVNTFRFEQVSFT